MTRRWLPALLVLLGLLLPLTACEQSTTSYRNVESGAVVGRRSCTSCWWRYEITIARSGVRTPIKVSSTTWARCPVGAQYPRCRSLRAGGAS
ncbi:hypothetical protein [Sphaerisporangium sp. TRM90804]|uniref:hypothetical protein n=1 Tax=Sphaerisporangium sp. TRM90804 TaxID=3031113 RepID=UPI00244855EB|nr:hypothetical protein [Sphaerisporangium sp. TRM90804]MDH2429293.1 hypothetical protein [Sphaerisporangium sp. TRM90804]